LVDGKPKGTIQVSEIGVEGESGISLTGATGDFCIRLANKSYNLQATSAAIANEWLDAIKDWLSFLSSSDK
jgi:hypothetical protein